MQVFNCAAITAQSSSLFFSSPACLFPARAQLKKCRSSFGSRFIVASSSAVTPARWEDWAPEKGSKTPSLSDVVWPATGAFAAMALLGKIDQILISKGVSSITIAPLGAVCAVLFATPTSPGARKYNMFMGQIGCAAIGVASLTLFGPGWIARSVGLSAAIAFMIYTRSVHPPAASLPILFIDGAKLHHLNFWFALFPGAAACLILCLIVSNFIDNALLYTVLPTLITNISFSSKKLCCT
ncbi:uncharacterized protein LOC124920360 [Impatiens glandulifera]|uniref:uncharacterized protein LOC124920360 n=1 Tax=Impatiens glandulifera TaxID=253017 RepID=UPI001FB1091C|nr:uncharacterized protein LOC124920360 [Impatiens glandulifera]